MNWREVIDGRAARSRSSGPRTNGRPSWPGMNRSQFEHILRAYKGTTRETKFVIIGSQSVLG